MSLDQSEEHPSRKPSASKEIDLHNTKSMSVFTRLASISALTGISGILHIVTTEINDLMEAAGSSIYLVPDVNPSFRDTLFRDGQEFAYDREQHDHIIVLASTTRSDMKEFVGKAFYELGEGITGWVYREKKPLNIKDTSDPEELTTLAPDLIWKDVYHSGRYYYDMDEQKPLLIVPLVHDDRQIGVVKFHAKARHQPFSDWDEKLAILVGNFLSSAIALSVEMETQKNTILELIEIGSKHDKEQVFIELSKSMTYLLRSERSQIYMFSNDENSILSLQVENGKQIKAGRSYTRGSGLIGWVYKTGKPLIIDDLHAFSEINYLTDEHLEKYSDSTSINDTDREISCEVYNESGRQYPVTFIAVPVRQDGEVVGVLSAQSKYGNSFKRSKAFVKPEDLNLAISFARIACNALEYEQEERQGDLLLKLGLAQTVDSLFDLVIKEIPKLVSSAGCSIFEYHKGVYGPTLQLVKTSRQGLLQEDGKPIHLSYRLGEDKTGMCGLSRCTIVFNHYGVGDVSEDAMDQEARRIGGRFTDDYVDRLLDEKGMQVGLIQTRLGKKCSREIRADLVAMAQAQCVAEQGLPSAKISHTAPATKPAWSFAAIPIKDEKGLFGVITISRPVAENPFSSHDIYTVETVANRLGHFIGNIKLQEQRKELLMTVAHEVYTPLTAILADSENLKNESASQNMKALADNVIEQVLRLQLFTETIMGAVPESADDKEGVPVTFEYINIGDLLHEARRMFKSEAEFKGCDILEPKSIAETQFPFIEISSFHLGIAIKNIMHNAVKYSFRPVKGSSRNRFINVWGIWSPGSRQVYKISIQNYGVEISREEIEKRWIFEPYYRGKKAGDRRRTGAGFGLSYARQVVEEMHHGRIDVTSVPAGEKRPDSTSEAYITTFTISLPVIHSPVFEMHKQEKTP